MAGLGIVRTATLPRSLPGLSTVTVQYIQFNVATFQFQRVCEPGSEGVRGKSVEMAMNIRQKRSARLVQLGAAVHHEKSVYKLYVYICTRTHTYAASQVRVHSGGTGTNPQNC